MANNLDDVELLHVEIEIVHALSGVLLYKKYRFIQHGILYSKFEIPLVCNEIASSKVQPYNNTVSFSCNLTQVCTSRCTILNLRIFCVGEDRSEERRVGKEC